MAGRLLESFSQTVLPLFIRMVSCGQQIMNVFDARGWSFLLGLCCCALRTCAFSAQSLVTSSTADEGLELCQCKILLFWSVDSSKRTQEPVPPVAEGRCRLKCNSGWGWASWNEASVSSNSFHCSAWKETVRANIQHAACPESVAVVLLINQSGKFLWDTMVYSLQVWKFCE